MEWMNVGKKGVRIGRIGINNQCTCILINTYPYVHLHKYNLIKYILYYDMILHISTH